ncbi:hypothetical protein C2W58_00741 [Bacillus pumilus]|uniref:Uncharacterized protein n=1 Tax=Bacillus pumilus TaxID=1408 RepID=A0AB34QXY6_BACPU|nr:hypothetical protein B4127_0834 [Bacillus pumilus]RAP09060.1 hypothetical protein C2W58_00741 [Bacillus pumilus]
MFQYFPFLLSIRLFSQMKRRPSFNERLILLHEISTSFLEQLFCLLFVEPPCV